MGILPPQISKQVFVQRRLTRAAQG